MSEAQGFLDQRAGLFGRKAAVIGGGGGIGAGITLALAEAGVDVAICDIDQDQMAVTVAEAKGHGREVLSALVDATDPAALDSFYDEVTQGFGNLDIVVNVVGGTFRTSFMEMDRDAIARDIQRNYGYVVQSVQRAVQLIRAGGRGGSIINFTTIEAHRGAASFSVYAGAKAATTNFTRSMAVELGKEGIRLNCIAPDTTPSNGNNSAMPPEIAASFANLSPETMGKGMAMYIPIGSPPPIAALANAVLFLASDLAAFVSGITMHVDGGTMAAAGFLDWPYGDGFVPVALSGTLPYIFPENA
ncbi:SDR family NAD(P)-dependent oxidoreductase [Novosphingobium taihuense]|uniref:NAD(P)-dependent dehydrogenase (Short-subunit alcohol dehydrogenase family) n=1 Tax=Novosphingobium taihuense TaxID=260085 RepID=A0A7W7EV35_9SPHN|nr:SDR family oxidoreductase [Novosphingobium taihuense]MBB4615047.1 NAD(P)-dependent dehydrogenase (short-subunit alcohol dehydrogenase family) [Novosphingobium taihuense]TWH79280.1 NAD(P)-dependent dehydrogenase (short-subunit alcohol dehydrogenase family) [Novosphingobium taihuense]